MAEPITVWWHELNTWHPDEARDFYTRTLGWTFEKVQLPDGEDYCVARKDGRAVGGLFRLTEPHYQGIPSHWMTYMAVKDITLAERSTAFAGGEITRPATEVPGVGKLAVVTDASGALIGLIEPDRNHAFGPVAN